MKLNVNLFRNKPCYNSSDVMAKFMDGNADKSDIFHNGPIGSVSLWKPKNG